MAGRPLMILEGDYYVGKACGSVTIDHPDIGLIDVFTSHVSITNNDSRTTHIYIYTYIKTMIDTSMLRR